jgi:hypothetical protein
MSLRACMLAGLDVEPEEMLSCAVTSAVVMAGYRDGVSW